MRTCYHGKAFTLYIYDSAKGIGAAPLMPDNSQMLGPVLYYSVKLQPHQCKHLATELESIELVGALKNDFELFAWTLISYLSVF